MPTARLSAGARRRQYHAVHTALAFHLGVIRPGPNFHRTSAMTIQFDETGQDWRVWISAVPSEASPKRETEVTTGFWRKTSSKGHATPCATWFTETVPQAKLGGEDAEVIDPDCGDEWYRFASETWPKLKACQEEEYHTALATGFWPDGVPTTKRDGIGGNEGPELADDERLAKKLKILEAEVTAWLKSLGWTPMAKDWKPATKADADKTVTYQGRFQEIESEAERLRVAESDPLHKAWKAAIEKWKPLVTGAKTLKDQVYEMGQAYVRAENARLRDEARLEAERIANEEREAAAAAGPDAEPAPVKVAPVVAQTVSIGATKRVTEHKLPPHVEVGDDAAFAAFLAAESDPDLKACLLKVARAKVKANVAHLPGVLVDGKPRVAATV